MNNLQIEDVTEFLILDYILKETKYLYCFSTSINRSWNSEINIERKNDGSVFYQIKPDGLDGGFFNWYALERQHNQFFETKEEAFIEFMRYRKIWKNR